MGVLSCRLLCMRADRNKNKCTQCNSDARWTKSMTCAHDFQALRDLASLMREDVMRVSVTQVVVSIFGHYAGLSVSESH